VISHNWHELRRFMWDYVGIVRTNKRLERAGHRIRLLTEEIQEYYSNFRVTADLLDLRNLVTTADLIVRSAMSRHESRGLHFSRDYPGLLAEARDTVLKGPCGGRVRPDAMSEPYPDAPEVLGGSAVRHQDYREVSALPLRTDIDDDQQRGDECRAFYVSGQRFSISQGQFAPRTVFQKDFGHGMAG